LRRKPSFSPLVLLFLCLLSHTIFSLPSQIDSSQVIFVYPTAEKTIAKMVLYEVLAGEWQEMRRFESVALGRTGVIAGPLKREGDGHTPAGKYSIERVFGYEKVKKIKIPYIKIGKKDVWVDDPKSEYYNQHLVKKTDANVGIPITREPIYQLFIVIEHNTKEPIPGYGSMIFMHPWKETSKPTAGCVGIDLKDLRWIVHWLDANKNPQIIILEENPDTPPG
jgi:L,D-peptidoglycan transpeptidase YkuD (ErfK/YbiS/YcfS/YnhG family)